ncbi:EpsG family protein [Algoriphagus sp.]|uniref:EpsG family protein n=1 Tax=Algoriphagus sp. TaxID=1872435 RepID=UPI00391A0260
MFESSIVCSLIVICNYAFRNFKAEKSLFIGFAILFVFQAVRYDYGNDYMSYFHNFNEVKHLPFNHDTIVGFGEKNRIEIGYLYLIKIFPFSDFYIFIIFWSFFNCFAYFYFIKKYVFPNYYWFALALYLFWPGGMLVQLSAIRQTIAIFIFVWAYNFAEKRNLLKFILLLLFGGLIHSSILILMPLYFIVNQYILKDKLIYLFSIFFLLVLFADSGFKNNIIPYVDLYFNQYSHYLNDEWSEKIAETSISQSLFRIITFILILYAYKVGNIIERRVAVFSLFFILFSLLGSILFLVNRLSMFFVPFLIVSLPLALKNLRNFYLRNSLIFIILLYVIKQYFTFFYSEIYGGSYYEYKTIFNMF